MPSDAPADNEFFIRKCPYCRKEVPFRFFKTKTVTSLLGDTRCRWFAQCPHCHEWAEAVLAWPDEGDGIVGWFLQSVHPFVTAQLTEDQDG